MPKFNKTPKIQAPTIDDPAIVSLENDALAEETMKTAGGSNSLAANIARFDQALDTIHYDGNNDLRKKASVCHALRGIDPQNDLEGMLAGQMVGVHNAVMECLRRAMIPDQHPKGREYNLSAANKLSRTFTMQMEALQRYRRKGHQKVTVEHVHVAAGGQAIVGNISK